MRGFVSLVLLGLVLLNTLGYHALLESQYASVQRETRISLQNDEISNAQLLTFKVPLNVPYASDAEEYTSVEGEFQHEGEFYQLIKQKRYKDTLYIVCYRDVKATEHHRQLADYVKTFTDQPAGAKGSEGKTAATWVKDFVSHMLTEVQPNQSFRFVCTYTAYINTYRFLFTPSSLHPPQGV